MIGWMDNLLCACVAETEVLRSELIESASHYLNDETERSHVVYLAMQTPSLVHKAIRCVYEMGGNASRLTLFRPNV